MASLEEGAEFVTNFLDSLLEVEMREEDGEVDISKNEDPLSEDGGALPPIPTFDLQNQTFTYKTQIIQPEFRNSGLVASVVPNILPMVSPVPILNSNSIIAIQPKNLLPTVGSAVTTNANTFVSKSNNKTQIKAIKTIGESQQMFVARFLRQVFKPEFIKNVFTRKDAQNNISEIGPQEMDYYKTCFKDVSYVRYCRIHCTICDKHLGCSIAAEKKLMVHKMLKVLTCKPCSEFYGDGNFPCDTGDNCEIYCHWCGQGGALVCCSFCPRVFCKKCVKRNFGASFLRSIQRALEWACFCCAQKPLWPHRAVCRALMEYIRVKKTDPRATVKDTTTCCASLLNKKKVPKTLDRNRILASGGPVAGIGPISNVSVSPSSLKNKIIVPIRSVTGNEHSILKSNVKIRVDSRDRVSSKTAIKILNENSGSVLSPRPPLPVATGFFSKGSQALPEPKNNFLAVAGPQSIQRPVIHGETVITPPASRKLVLPPESQIREGDFSSSVEVSLSPRETSDVDGAKIPTAKFPPDLQEFVLRIAFPDKKVQFVRLTSDANGCNVSNHFPMPDFVESPKTTFLERNLRDSFELSKKIYEKLKAIKQKINVKSELGERKVLSLSVDKLHLLYEKSIELFKDLDKDLLRKYEEWKADGLVDSGSPQGDFPERCKRALASDDDSDIEILETPEVDSPTQVVPPSNRERVATGKKKRSTRRKGTRL